MATQLYGPRTVGCGAVVTVLLSGVLPSDAWPGASHWHGGGFHRGGFHGGFQHVGVHHGGFHHGLHHLHHGFHRPPFCLHRPCCCGPRVFIGVGVGRPLLYPYPYPYAPPVVVERARPVYVQPPPPYRSYCQGAQADYR